MGHNFLDRSFVHTLTTSSEIDRRFFLMAMGGNREPEVGGLRDLPEFLKDISKERKGLRKGNYTIKRKPGYKELGRQTRLSHTPNEDIDPTFLYL